MHRELRQSCDICQFAKEFWADYGASKGEQHCATRIRIMLAGCEIQTNFLRKTMNARCTWENKFMPEGKTTRTYQLLQVFPIFPLEAAISFPHPIPTWSMLGSSSKEDDGVIRFDCSVSVTMCADRQIDRLRTVQV